MVFEMIGRYSGKFYSKSKVCLTFQVMICNAYKLELVANTAHVIIFIRFWNLKLNGHSHPYRNKFDPILPETQICICN